MIPAAVLGLVEHCRGSLGMTLASVAIYAAAHQEEDAALRCRLQSGACTKGHPTGTAEGGLSLSYFATDQTRYGRMSSMRPSAQ
jgi:hypothetical protein